MSTPNNSNPDSHQNPGGKWDSHPNPQQPQSPQQEPQQAQWGNQPTPQQEPQQPQWGSPQAQPQWGGQPPANNGGPKQITLPSWPTLVMAGFFLLTFITSFFTAFRFYVGLGDYGGWGGSIGGRINWWGSLTPETTGLGSLGESQLVEQYGSSGFLYGFGTAVILGCYIAATVLYYLGKEKLGALLGIIASGLQLLYTFLILVGFAGNEDYSLGGAWWMWFLFAIIALPLSIFLFIKGTAGVEGQFAKTKSSLQEAQARGAQKRQAQQPAQSANQQTVQPQQQGNPQQPQQPGSTAVQDTPNTSAQKPANPNGPENNNPSGSTN